MQSRWVLEEAGRKGTDIIAEDKFGVSSINSHTLFSLKVWRKLGIVWVQHQLSLDWCNHFEAEEQILQLCKPSQKWSRGTSLNSSTYPLPDVWGCTKFGTAAPFWPPHAAALKPPLMVDSTHSQTNRLDNGANTKAETRSYCPWPGDADVLVSS